MTTYAVTGASGQLGKLVLDELLQRVGPGSIVALVRDPAKLADYAEKGIEVRKFDYNDDASTLAGALAGVDRLLLISGSEVGQRERQHGNVIDAAKAAGVSYIAYTSILRADRSRLPLAAEHLVTEKLLANSGLTHDILRHGWYSENYTGSLKQSVANGAVLDATGEGRISAATRADYAAGDAAILVSGTGGKVYEFAGDEGFTMAEFAEILSEESGQPVSFRNLPQDEYAKLLEGFGLPAPVAEMLAVTSVLVGEGELENRGNDLSAASGRPTTPIRETIREHLNA